MARIAGINIPNHQHAEIALTAIYGIGRARARAILAAAGVQPNRKIKDLNDSELDRIRESIAPYSRFVRAEGDKLQTSEQELRAISADLASLRARIEKQAA